MNSFFFLFSLVSEVFDRIFWQDEQKIGLLAGYEE